jgi:hypothetical protein
MEREILAERTKAGVAAVKSKGKRLGRPRALASAIRCYAVAAFARVARQITGCSPTTSYIGELLDERRAVMEVEMVMTCSRKGPQIQFTPELGLRLRGDRKKVAKSTRFLAALSQFLISSVKSECDGECRPRPGGATIRLRYRRALTVSVDSAAAGGRGPRGGVWSPPTGGDLLAPKKSAQVLFWSQPRHCPGGSRPPGRGLKPGGVRPVIGGAAVLAGGVCRRGG